MDENESNINNNEELPVEQSSSREVSNSNNTIRKKIQEKVSKSSVKNAAKQTLLRALMPIITWGAIFIIALIIIIGIALFFITMPGMAIEQIKALASKVGNAVASWFGADVTKQVEDVEIYETLEYLENMGYDLKGYGFLTDFVGDSKDGVERDENDKITNAKSEFISTYLVSDNYVYTIKNFNLVASNPLEAIGKHIASIFVDKSKWTVGMLDIGLDGGNLGTKVSNYTKGEMGYIKIDSDKKTMEIKRGWFNNSMTYNLDGWTGRYGMPIDFLLSVHIATMMPDLAYDMATNFKTEVELLLHPIGGGEKDSNTVVGYYKTSKGYFAYDDFYDAAGTGITGFLNSWNISDKEAKNIMVEFGIESPSNCNYVTELSQQAVDQSEGEYITGIDPTIKYSLEETVSDYNDMVEKLEEYNYTGTLIPKNIDVDELQNLMTDIEENKVGISNPNLDYYQYTNGGITYHFAEYDINKAATIVDSWSDPNNEFTYTVTVELMYKKFKGVTSDDYNNSFLILKDSLYETYKEYCDERGYEQKFSQVSYKITRNATQEELKNAGVNNAQDAKCSTNENVERCCTVCIDYINRIYELIKEADVSELDIYQPYISKVTDHWYRDVYFVSNGKQDNFINYDSEYEAIMKERWTLYETYEAKDKKPDMIGEYKLYEIDDNGKYKEKNGQLVLYKGTSEEAASKGIKVAKKAKTTAIGEMYEDINWNEVNGLLSAYEIKQASQEEFQPVYPNIQEGDEEYEIKKNVYANVITTGNVIQTGEGQRIETNDKIKKIFLNNTYFRYDGSAKTAEIIKKLRYTINPEGYYGTLKGIDSNDKEFDYTDIEYTEDGEAYKVSDYSGQVSLNQDSLNAFSMLENEHTLDADYIYRDFKELIVELGYFKKEELTDETPRIMQWLIPDIGSAPNASGETNSNLYGEKIVEAAKKVYDYGIKHNYTYHNSSTDVGIIDITDESGGAGYTMCSGFVASVLVEAGIYDVESFTYENKGKEKTWAPYAIEFWWFGQKAYGGSKKKTNINGQTIYEYMCEKFNDMELVQDTSKEGKEIDFSKLEPGDIIVSKHKLDTEKDVTGHVAIYAGENKIYHSTGGEGSPGVHYSDIAGAGGEGGWTRAIRVTGGSSAPESSGSSGWPYRKLDKKVDVPGTLIHSKGDMDVAKSMVLMDVIKKEAEARENKTNGEENVDNGDAEYKEDEQKTKENDENPIKIEDDSTIKTEVGNIEIESNIDLSNSVGSVSKDIERIPEEGDGYSYKIKIGNVEYTHYYQFQGSYTGNSFGGGTIGDSGCGPTSCCNILTGYGVDVTPDETASVCKTFQPGHVGGSTGDALVQTLKEFDVPAQFIGTNDDAEVVKLMEEAFAEGKPVIVNARADEGPDTFWTKKGHFIACIGVDSSGNLITADPGSSNTERHTYSKGIEGIAQYTVALIIPDEAPTGVKSAGEEYEGYLGNEAVVSPVTGVLLEYGTFNGEKDSISGEEYRTNLDLKYGIEGITTNIDGGKIQKDCVGYAKILVLDKKNYELLESAIKSSGKTSLKSEFLTSKGVYKDIKDLSEETIEEWSDIDKTLYGYKEFAELYEEYGIEGNILYIDGFKCELPDEEFQIDEDSSENDDTKIDDNTTKKEFPDGKDLSMKSYSEAVTLEMFDNEGNIVSAENMIESLYEIDEEYKLPSEKISNRLNAESIIKADAVSTLNINGIQFIKEGTIIGRTITDKELIVEYRKEKYEDYRPTEENDNNKIIGNYLRITMNNKDKSVVENVEDYMKLDDGLDDNSRVAVDWEFYYWLPYESGPLGAVGEATHDGPGACGTVSGVDEVAVGFAQWTCVRTEEWNNIPPLCKWLAEEDPTLCRSLLSFSTYSNDMICDNLSSLQSAWWSVNQKDTDRFLELQMKYFYENDFVPLVEEKGLDWILEKELVTQGTLASVMNYSPYPETDGFPSWQSVIDESMSDKDIVMALLKNANPIKSTCGYLTDRWNAQAALACDILDGKFRDVEEWVRTKQPSSEYGEGTHDGLIGIQNKNFNFKYDYAYKNELEFLGGTYEEEKK